MDPRIQPTAHQEDQATQEEEQRYEVEHIGAERQICGAEQHTGGEEEHTYHSTPERTHFTLPPALSPQYQTPRQPSTTDFLHFMHYMEETRRHDKIRRQREEQERRQIEEIRRQEELLRRDEENERFTALMTLLASPRHSPAPAQPSSTSVHGGDGDTDSTGTPAPTLPPSHLHRKLPPRRPHHSNPTLPSRCLESGGDGGTIMQLW
ncbi:hypothetical protein Pcinc_019468 [Petrolisthes cinctipes]|uniref:Uncharacterized protein n=1 Tax=Petrolisthes cinctipes TaxID=88211 RepID=A0AAE1KHQ0_PETCI|nr:hypothetical protein Pcinc_019468 [Petrolisthes cinctipes]